MPARTYALTPTTTIHCYPQDALRVRGRTVEPEGLESGSDTELAERAAQDPFFREAMAEMEAEAAEAAEEGNSFDKSRDVGTIAAGSSVATEGKTKETQKAKKARRRAERRQLQDLSDGEAEEQHFDMKEIAMDEARSSKTKKRRAKKAGKEVH